jgi:hypothetical protein
MYVAIDNATDNLFWNFLTKLRPHFIIFCFAGDVHESLWSCKKIESSEIFPSAKYVCG